MSEESESGGAGDGRLPHPVSKDDVGISPLVRAQVQQQFKNKAKLFEFDTFFDSGQPSGTQGPRFNRLVLPVEVDLDPDPDNNGPGVSVHVSHSFLDIV